jgi:hypothetical protein
MGGAEWGSSRVAVLVNLSRLSELDGVVVSYQIHQRGVYPPMPKLNPSRTSVV